MKNKPTKPAKTAKTTKTTKPAKISRTPRRPKPKYTWEKYNSPKKFWLDAHGLELVDYNINILTKTNIELVRQIEVHLKPSLKRCKFISRVLLKLYMFFTLYKNIENIDKTKKYLDDSCTQRIYNKWRKHTT